MKYETRRSKRGHEYTVIHGAIRSVSVFQAPHDRTGKLGSIKVRWPFACFDEKQHKKVFGPDSYEAALRYAEAVAEGLIEAP